MIKHHVRLSIICSILVMTGYDEQDDEWIALVYIEATSTTVDKTLYLLYICTSDVTTSDMQEWIRSAIAKF